MRKQENWPELLSSFWQAVERDVGVSRLLTQPHEPMFEQGYEAFLTQLGYTPDLNFRRWWSKAYQPPEPPG